MKRNLINEITAIKSRSEFNSRQDYSSRLYAIEYALQENLDYNGLLNKELLKYIPIATVACFETFFRSVYKELVDFGKPFSDNVVKFNQSQNVRFDFDIVNAIQTKTVTVGEFISHILPCNNFDDINKNLSLLCGIDFADEIYKFKRENVSEHLRDNSIQFICNGDQIIADIKRTFELRHIFCHEFATNIHIDRDEILRCFNNAKFFLNQTNDFIWDLMYPNEPETQADMNNHASEQFAQADKELTELIITIKDATKELTYMEQTTVLLDETITEWKKYRDKKAEMNASVVVGGSMYPTVYASSLTTTTRELIESLKNQYALYLRRHASK